eukprot:ANDGO_04446.mRNA.1 Protein CMS1
MERKRERIADFEPTTVLASGDDSHFAVGKMKKKKNHDNSDDRHKSRDSAKKNGLKISVTRFDLLEDEQFGNSLKKLMTDVLCTGKNATVSADDIHDLKLSTPVMLKTAPQSPPAPHIILIITHSALRALEIIKMVSKSEERVVAKLFARHLKAEEQAQFLKTKDVGLGVGTPSRILQLYRMGALMPEKVSQLIFDVEPDVKNMCVLTNNDTQKDAVLLMHEYGADSIISAFQGVYQEPVEHVAPTQKHRVEVQQLEPEDAEEERWRNQKKKRQTPPVGPPGNGRRNY